jgi:GNAT superfamily N-acetyltransferase
MKTKNKELTIKDVPKSTLRKIGYKIKEIRLCKNANFIKFYEKLQEKMFKNNYFDLTPIILENQKKYYDDKPVAYFYDTPVIYIADPEICIVQFIPKDDGIELFILETFNRGKGIGSSLMKLFNEVSMETGVKIYLKPGNIVGSDGGDAVRRRKFYHVHGFKRKDVKTKYWTN